MDQMIESYPHQYASMGVKSLQDILQWDIWYRMITGMEDRWKTHHSVGPVRMDKTPQCMTCQNGQDTTV